MCLKILPKTRIMNLPVFSTFICLLLSYAAAVENTVPVFMLDYDYVMRHIHVDRNPFRKVPSNDFANIVEEFTKYKTIIFLEETFSVEDISTKDQMFGTPYRHLQANLLIDLNKVKYLPSVIQPVKVLNETYPQNMDNVFYLAQHTKLQLKDSLRYMYMYFKDAQNETKANKLKRHDIIIRDIMGALRAMKTGPIIAYYTGKQNSTTVKKVNLARGSKSEPRKKGLIVQTPRVLFQLYGVHTTQQSRRFYYEQQPTFIKEIPAKHMLTATFLLENIEVKWKFHFFKTRWEITDLYLMEADEQVGHATMHAGAPNNFSYYCTEPLHVFHIRTGSYLTINSMLIDPANQNAPAGKPYNPLIHCSPLFSSDSLSCFVCASLIFAILVCGILVMLELSSYDRYDDANHKPLTHERMH